jgi:hypothetical protein
MTTRLTALLSLLLVMGASFGLPVTRGPAARVTAAIVCEYREREPQRIEPPAPVPTPPPYVQPAAADSPAPALLDYSLFQRPPPAA